jgi:ABC-2 type transport system permease protein
MKRAFTVALREVRSYLLDKGDLAFSLLLPIAIFAVIYGAFGGQMQFNGTAHIVNEDTGADGVNFSAALLARLEKIDGLAVELMSAEDATRELEKSNILLAVYIPADFSRQLAAGQPAQIIIRQRGNAGTDGQIVASMVSGAAEQLNREFQVQQRVSELVAGKGIPSDQITVAVQRFLNREQEAPLIEVTETTVGSSPDPVNQFLPGILAMFVLFAVSLSAQTIVEERKKGTLERMLTTRLTRSELFFGKFISGIFRGFLQTLILLILAYIVFGIFTPLSLLQVLLVALIFSAAASALGLVIAAISRTADQAVWISVVFTNVSVILGGTFFTLPEGGLIGVLGKLSISTYVNTALAGLIAEGKNLAGVGMQVLILLGVTIVALVISRLLFRPVVGGGR